MQGGDLLQYTVHAHGGIDGGIYFVVMRAGVHDQNLGPGLEPSYHVRQVMAIVLGQVAPRMTRSKVSRRRASITACGGCCGQVMTSFGHLGGLGRKRMFVGLAIENLDVALDWLLERTSERISVQLRAMALLELTRSLAIGGHPSEVTEDQGPQRRNSARDGASAAREVLLSSQLGSFCWAWLMSLDSRSAC